MTASPASDRRTALTRGRWVTLPLVLALALVGCSLPGCDDASAPTSTETFSRPAVTPAADPLLIKHGWDVPDVDFVQANAASIDALPFDGITMVLPDDLSSRVQSQTPVSLQELRAALAPLADTTLRQVRHNFVMVYSAPAGDLFDDWTVPAQNFANLARAAREAGLEGLFYDVEEYFGDALRYPASCVDRDVVTCQAQAQQRGEQVMDGIRSGWPQATVLTTFGPWLSEPRTAENLSGVPYDDVSFANQLVGPFVVGMVASATGTRATVVDGGEIYTPREKDQFATVKAWQEQGMPALSPLVPERLQPTWADTVSAAFGVYDQPWVGVDMDVDVWGTTLANALATTDEYVWAYTERYDWTGTGWPEEPVPDEWLDATRAAQRTG